MTHQAISHSFLDSRVPACIYQITWIIFQFVFKFKINGRLPHYANTVSPRFNMQLIFSAGLQYQWPGAVLATNMWSRLWNFYKAIIAILTPRNVVRCSGPPSVYIIRAGGICSMEPHFAINTSATSCAFLEAEKGLMAVIFNRTFGSPLYHESSTLSLIWLIKITVGINDKFEKSWSATWKTLFFPASTQRPQGKAATGKPGYPTDILCLSSMQIKLTKSWILKAYSLAYL